jgi:hypothetical protein
MLVLKRKEGQWIEITHARTGDVLRIRLYDVVGGLPGRANLAFDDPARNFAIERPERRLAPRADAPTPPAESVA